MKIVGHRGAKGEAPENTLPSFKHAYGQGIRHFELDVRLSSDGELMTIHDKTTDRTTGLSGNVAELTAKQLTSIDAGQPLPRDVQEWFTIGADAFLDGEEKTLCKALGLRGRGIDGDVAGVLLP